MFMAFGVCRILLSDAMLNLPDKDKAILRYQRYGEPLSTSSILALYGPLP
jgi:hypothetical protein